MKGWLIVPKVLFVKKGDREMIFKKMNWFFKKKKVEEQTVIDLNLSKIFNSSPFSMNDLSLTAWRAEIEAAREKKDRIPKKPIEIIHEVEVGVAFPKDKIKETIRELKARINFMDKTLKINTSDEHRALQMLEAREKYPKYSHLFQWKTTTLRHVTALIGKYELDHRGIEEYVRSIPHEAIQAMKLYADIMRNVSKNAPKFSLIAPPEYFRDPKNSTDPILLAESPFGNFYYILVAWDNEISKVSELLDGEKLLVTGENGNKEIKS